MFEGMRDIQIWDALSKRWNLNEEERGVLLEALTECERGVLKDLRGEVGNEDTVHGTSGSGSLADH